MNYNYRFSIIPPGAVTDPRVTPRALQVLCLLGRHIDNDGWCVRSQVKMARELSCSRSAVQEACDILLETGWAERRANGRGGTGPETTSQPFAAYSYRVRLDRNDMPVAPAQPEPESEAAPAEGGAAIAAGGAALAAGGAAPAAPLEGISSEGISSEPERERARAHEEFAKWLAAFKLRWPTSAADDQARVATAARVLTKAQRDAALDRIADFLEQLKKLKRKHIPSGWKYLEDRRWEMLERQTNQQVPTGREVDPGSAEGRAYGVLCRVAQYSPLLTNAGAYFLRQPLPPQVLALGNAAPFEEWPFISILDRHECGAWNDLLRAHLSGVARRPLVNDRNDRREMGFYAPWQWPPRKDGSLSRAPPSESQPESENAQALTE